jgi:hypothetical protein
MRDLPRRSTGSIAGWIFPVTGRELSRDRAQGAESPCDWLSPVGRRSQRKRRRRFDSSVVQQKRLSSSVAFDRLGSPSNYENRSARMKHWQAIAEKLSNAGFSWGCSCEIDSTGRCFSRRTLTLPTFRASAFWQTKDSPHFWNLSELLAMRRASGRKTDCVSGTRIGDSRCPTRRSMRMLRATFGVLLQAIAVGRRQAYF